MRVECYNCGYIAEAQKFITTQGPSEWQFVELCCPQCSTKPEQLGREGTPAPFKMEKELSIGDGKLRIQSPKGGTLIVPLLPDYPVENVLKLASRSK